MNYHFDPKENDRMAEGRESFSGRPLSNSKFDEGIAITGIIEGEIVCSGSFTEKLGDYAYAFARTEKFDVAKAESILRDLFKARTGLTMNQMREELMEREAKLTATEKRGGHAYALAVGEMIQNGDKITFHRAYAHQGQAFAEELGITHAGAKRLMKEEFQAAGQGDFYEWGKEIEEKFYRPQIEAERQRRQEATNVNEDGTRTRTQPGSPRSRMQYRR